MEGLITEALNAGFEVIPSKEHNEKLIKSDEDFLNLPINGIDGVIVGFDSQFNYYKLCFASLCI